MVKISVRESVRFKTGGSAMRVTSVLEQDGGPTLVGLTWIDNLGDQHVSSATEDDLEIIDDEAVQPIA